jgi:hypothetical protein
MRVVSVIEIFRKLTEVSGSKPIVTASATRLTGDLDGPRGFVFFLLIMVAPLFIAAGVTMTFWRLTNGGFLAANVRRSRASLVRAFGFPHNLRLRAASNQLAVMGIIRSEDSAGAAGMWALTSIAASAAIVLFGTAVALTRLALHGRK